MQNTENIIVFQEGIENQILKEKVKKPRSEKQLENDKKLGQRLKDKKLKEQQLQLQLDKECDSEVQGITDGMTPLNTVIPPVRKTSRPKLTRSNSKHVSPCIMTIRESLIEA